MRTPPLSKAILALAALLAPAARSQWDTMSMHHEEQSPTAPSTTLTLSVLVALSVDGKPSPQMASSSSSTAKTKNRSAGCATSLQSPSRPLNKAPQQQIPRTSQQEVRAEDISRSRSSLSSRFAYLSLSSNQVTGCMKCKPTRFPTVSTMHPPSPSPPHPSSASAATDA